MNVEQRFESLDKSLPLESKSYLFKNMQPFQSQFKGLNEIGPFLSCEKKLELYIITRSKDKDLIEDFRKVIQNKEQNQINFKFLFQSEINITGITEIEEYNYEILNKIKNVLINLRNDNNDKIVFPIVINRKNQDDIYYRLKSDLIAESIPVQFITKELVNNKEVFKWAIPNIILQIFCKCGGIPWLVKSNNKKCIIFGLGQSHKKDNGKIIKYFSYSVCTESTGLYKQINILGNSADLNTYINTFEKKIYDKLRQEIHKYSKCVLHVPFKVRQDELKAIFNVLKKLNTEKSEKEIEFLVLRINVKNKFFGFSNSNSLVPLEGSCVKLSEIKPSYLIWFEGTQPEKGSISKRIPGPVYVEFLWSNKNWDEINQADYLQDLFNLSGANWRGFNATSLPISVLYCNLIAKYLKNFPVQIDNLNNIEIPWFL